MTDNSKAEATETCGSPMNDNPPHVAETAKSEPQATPAQTRDISILTINQKGKNMFKLEEGQHRFTEIQVLDAPSEGGAYHLYLVCDAVSEEYQQAILAQISFQIGPVAEVGTNGIFIEDLLQICRHRLQCFQAGEFSCRENELALTKIEEALHWLNHRTADRQKRKVEGTYKK